MLPLKQPWFRALSDAALSVWPEASPPASRFEPVTPLFLGLSLGAPGAWVETELLLNSQYTGVVPVLPAAAADLPPFPLREAPQTLCNQGNHGHPRPRISMVTRVISAQTAFVLLPTTWLLALWAPVPGNLDPKKERSLRSGPQSCCSPGSLLGPQRKKPPHPAGRPWGTVQHEPGGFRSVVLRREAPRGTCRSCCSHRSPSEGAAYPHAEHSCCWAVLPIGTLVLNHRARQIARVELRLPPPLTEIATALQTGHWLQIWEVPFPRAPVDSRPGLRMGQLHCSHPPWHNLFIPGQLRSCEPLEKAIQWN